MRILIPIYVFLLCIFCFPCNSEAKKGKIRLPDKPEVADSILANVLRFAPMYEKIVDDYRADVYIKGTLNVKKSNRLFRYVPTLFKLEKNVRQYMLESVSEVHYSAPNIFDVKTKAIMGTVPRFKGVRSNTLEYLNMNIYSTELLSDKLLSPLAQNARKHYRFLLDTITIDEGLPQYKILIIPRNKSVQLVNGYMVVSDQLWTVRKMYLEGQFEFLRFKVNIEMGEKGKEEFLPERFDVLLKFRFLGNKLDASYSAFYKYNEITIDEEIRETAPKKSKYDLSESYTLSCSSSAFLTDSVEFERLRPIPLNEREKKIYEDYAFRRDTTEQNKVPKKRSQVFFGQVGDVMLRHYTVDMANFGSVRCSPIINPLLFSYSGGNGFSYRQEFKYNRLFVGDKLLRIVPRLGYNFTRKEFYWGVNSDFDYWPEKRASLHLSFGNGNRIYSSDVLDEIKSIPDSVFDFNQIHLEYFRDLYFSLNHSMEVLNGLTISAGFTAHRRTPIEKSKFVAILPPTLGQIELIKNLRSVYISFAPRLRVDWTPGLYYYMSGKRKINLRSNYPTFSLDWERGIKGVFKSNSSYERLEFDMQHQIRLGLMRNIYYRLGIGAFTKQEQTYFVDFANFSRRNLPIGWNDDIGGVFQLLDGRWYNSSDQYLRGHFTYESPFLFLKHLLKYTSTVMNERLYASALIVPHLLPYVEVGYGIGTHIFDAGVFVSSSNWKFGKIGFKFTFELFNK